MSKIVFERWYFETNRKNVDLQFHFQLHHNVVMNHNEVMNQSDVTASGEQNMAY